jgi:hypothetical protein
MRGCCLALETDHRAPPPKLGYFDQNGDVQTFAERVTEYLSVTPLHNATDTPAMSVPLHWRADGLPVGNTGTCALRGCKAHDILRRLDEGLHDQINRYDGRYGRSRKMGGPLPARFCAARPDASMTTRSGAWSIPCCGRRTGGSAPSSRTIRATGSKSRSTTLADGQRQRNSSGIRASLCYNATGSFTEDQWSENPARSEHTLAQAEAALRAGPPGHPPDG